MTAEELWAQFTAAHHIEQDSYEAWAFGGDPDELARLVLAGEKEILESADQGGRHRIQEIEQRTYLKMVLRYLHKNHLRVFLLVETDEEAEAFYRYLEEEYSGIQIAGMARVSPVDAADELVVNAVNGAETDCVIAAMSAPVQERQ